MIIKQFTSKCCGGEKEGRGGEGRVGRGGDKGRGAASQVLIILRQSGLLGLLQYKHKFRVTSK